MNARLLQDAVVEDLTTLFQNHRFKTPDGKTAALSWFAQTLPMRDTDDDDDPFPYGIVRLDSGGVANKTDPHKVAILLMIGIFDDDRRNQGHRAVTEIMELIQQHYEENPLLNGAFVFSDPFAWALQDEESYPYFFGAANLTFELPAPRTKASIYT